MVETQNAPKVFTGYQADIAKYSKELNTRFGITPEASLAIARQAAQDVHNYLKGVERTFALGKVTKDGKVSLSDGCKLKGATMTKPMALIKACDWIAQAEANYVSFGFTGWKVTRMGNENSLAAYVEEMEKANPAKA
jgi:hypothetical protein